MSEKNFSFGSHEIQGILIPVINKQNVNIVNKLNTDKIILQRQIDGRSDETISIIRRSNALKSSVGSISRRNIREISDIFQR